MSPMYRISFIFFEGFADYIIYKISEYMEFDIISQTVIVVVSFAIITWLELKGINHKICEWTKNKWHNNNKTLDNFKIFYKLI